MTDIYLHFGCAHYLLLLLEQRRCQHTAPPGEGRHTHTTSRHGEIRPVRAAAGRSSRVNHARLGFAYDTICPTRALGPWLPADAPWSLTRTATTAPVSDVGLGYLARKLRKLQSLSLGYTNITSAGLLQITKRRQDTVFYEDGRGVISERREGLVSLVHLSIYNCAVTVREI